MAYEGNLVAQVYAYHGDFSRLYMVGVSGAGPNLWGHAILFVPGAKGNQYEGLYFHVVGADPGVFTVGDFPRCMPDYTSFKQYLDENGKTETFRRPFDIPNPTGSLDRLNELVSKPRVWLAIKHNCVTFVHAVVYSGGGSKYLFNNLPSLNHPSVWPPYESPLELIYF